MIVKKNSMLFGHKNSYRGPTMAGKGASGGQLFFHTNFLIKNAIPSSNFPIKKTFFFSSHSSKKLVREVFDQENTMEWKK